MTMVDCINRPSHKYNNQTSVPNVLTKFATSELKSVLVPITLFLFKYRKINNQR